MAEKHQHDRSEARRLALQVLYQAEILETDPATIIEEGRLVDETQLLGNYARRLIEGATADQEAIDAELVEASENWALDRMPVVDRSLLRMAAYEMRSVDALSTSSVSILTVLSGSICVGIGFMAAVMMSGMPVVMPPSKPPARFVLRMKPFFLSR